MAESERKTQSSDSRKEDEQIKLHPMGNNPNQIVQEPLSRLFSTRSSTTSIQSTDEFTKKRKFDYDLDKRHEENKDEDIQESYEYFDGDNLTANNQISTLVDELQILSKYRFKL